MKNFIALFTLGLLLVSCKNEPQTLTKISGKTTLIDSLINQDSLIIKEYLPYKEKMITEVNKVLSYTTQNLVRTDGRLQSSLGNLIADLSFEKANELFEKQTGKKVDFAMSNYGGIRAGIWKGEVKVIHAFNLMPFDNTIVVVELTADKVRELFKYFITQNRAHPLSKNIQLTISKNTIDIKINEKPIEDGKTYFVATSNYLQKGGDNMNFFAKPESLYDSNFLVRDAIVEYFKNQDTLRSKLDNRIIIR
ncbi:5'-nucleotidase C-terminal domain-containing protein [Pseudotenacibaculum sp. MALMAid0570]|uniref:5'-nucleotidase C-terminal domain-containing protein n=1 Tax=Pseudotenacibaculum sp. MALMAid0570 TaxID=3143938 RepID=UPI0032DE8082